MVQVALLSSLYLVGQSGEIPKSSTFAKRLIFGVRTSKQDDAMVCYFGPSWRLEYAGSSCGTSVDRSAEDLHNIFCLTSTDAIHPTRELYAGRWIAGSPDSMFALQQLCRLVHGKETGTHGLIGPGCLLGLRRFGASAADGDFRHS